MCSRKMRQLCTAVAFVSACLSWSGQLQASAAAQSYPDPSWYGPAVILVFFLAYAFVIGEEFLHLRKCKPVVVAAGIVWALVAASYAATGQAERAGELLRHNLLEYAELLLFLLCAMTYVNTLEERNVFAALRSRMIGRGLSLRTIYWATGLLAFFISPFADNLTTALVMGAVVLSVGAGHPRFITVGCLNIVVAANAGGAFSPFGDITTLMVWQKGVLSFSAFFALFIPALINWLLPATLTSFAIEKRKPSEQSFEIVPIKYGGVVVIGLFLFTIALAVGAHQFLRLPPVLGMMTGLGLLGLYSYLIRRDEQRGRKEHRPSEGVARIKGDLESFDILISAQRVEWDTLLFFYGVILCVGGLAALGYLTSMSQWMYGDLGATWANILVGVASALVDNIPLMFAVLTMNPDMSPGQWLLVTLTAGVGGSLLSIGSAAGVALMGQARGAYTFFSHLKWSWAVLLGYAVSIWAHLVLNARLF